MAVSAGAEAVSEAAARAAAGEERYLMEIKRGHSPGSFLTAEEKKMVEAAIKEAETGTSGEIVVMVSGKVEGDALDAAKKRFTKLGMHKTDLRNGVLILLATQSRSFAILGDEGIHRHVGDGGWLCLKDGMAERFRNGLFGEGLSFAVREVGGILKKHFPVAPDDINELPNHVVEE